MTKKEKSLLLYLEACAVDFGRVDGKRMSHDDAETLKRWTSEGYTESGRIRFSDVNSRGQLWVILSDEAWTAAHAERRARAARVWENRTWETTQEKRDKL